MRAARRRAFRCAVANGSTLCVLALALLARAAAAQDEGGNVVTRGPQGYSVDASQTNVVQVLTEVGQHAGFTVEAPDSFNSPITLSLQDAPLDQLLRRVLRDENYIIVYRGGVEKTTISGEGIDKIFLLSPAAAGQPPRPAGPAGVSPLAGPGAVAKPGQPGHGGPQPPGGDLATRAAQARAAADARRAALGQPPAPGPGGVAEAPAAMAGAGGPAHMVQTPEDVQPQQPAEFAPPEAQGAEEHEDSEE